MPPANAFDRYAAALDRAGRSQRAMAAGTQKLEARTRELNREADRNTAALKNQQRAADLASGAFGRHAAAMARLNAEARRLDQLESLAALIAQHGKFGGLVRANAGHLMVLGRTIAGVAGAGLAMGTGLARSGLQGTQEGMRLEMSWQRLSRQLAAVAIPAVEMLSSALQRVAGWFEGLSGRQQDTIMKFGLLAAGALAFAGALRVLVPLGAALAGIGATLGMAGAATAAAGAGTAAGAAGAAAGGAAGAGAAGTAAAAAGGGLLARGGRLAMRAVLPVAVGAAAIEYAPDRLDESEGPGSYYSRLRGEGRSRLGAGFATFGKSLERLGTATGLTEETFKADEEKKRRDVTPFGASSEEAGSAHFRIQEELLRVEMAREEALKDSTEAARELAKAIRDMTAGALAGGVRMAEDGPVSVLNPYDAALRAIREASRK